MTIGANAIDSVGTGVDIAAGLILLFINRLDGKK